MCRSIQLALFLALFHQLAHALPTSTSNLVPRPPSTPAPEWYVRSMKNMRGGGDMPLPLPLSRQNSIGVDAASAGAVS
eukprot:399859-Rhodomonas_salina.1